MPPRPAHRGRRTSFRSRRGGGRLTRGDDSRREGRVGVLVGAVCEAFISVFLPLLVEWLVDSGLR